MDADAVVAALAALAHPSRLAVFRALVERGPEGEHPGALAAALDLAPATLSFHLKSLAQARLVEAQPMGRHILYRADFAAMQALVGYLMRNCCGGDASRCLPAPKAARRARNSRPKRAPR